jgi:lipopolysaccharide/colanic/teichoic acid biosynthesis glycosyltransferase
MSKRLLDLVGAATGLLLLAPLGLLMAVAIKLDSPGPVFFRQLRVGRHGRLFTIHKFRTMRETTATQGEMLITPQGDPRVTRLGRWLRDTKLDELAQLIDVLRGDMSLVGPRPEVPRYVALYPEPLRQKILSVRPGITDPASLAYRHESRELGQSSDPEHTYIHTVMPIKLRLAAQYVDQASFWLDLRLIAATLKALVRR